MKKALLLDGSLSEDLTAARVYPALEKRLAAQGWEIEHIALRERKIGPCMGDFFCWIRTPGTCMLKDDNREIAAKAAHCDMLIFAGPMTFGGHAPLVKRMADHLPQNALPFFEKVDGEIHHVRRYPIQPDFLAIAWQPSPDPEEVEVFRRLAARNANNFRPQHTTSIPLGSWQDEASLGASLDEGLARLAKGKDPGPKAPAAQPLSRDLLPPRRALLLVGSPRGKQSTSHALGEHLLNQLSAKAIETRTVLLQPTIASSERTAELLAHVEDADLVVLASPLYVDSLPSTTIEALERIAASRAGSFGRKRLVAILNCGFPESFHNDVALSQCQIFARKAGMEWAGGLSLGGGQGMVSGRPLREIKARARSAIQVLDQAAEHLARGAALPPEVQKPWNRPFLPGWLYRLAGSFGWKSQAHRWGVQKELYRAPYAE